MQDIVREMLDTIEDYRQRSPLVRHESGQMVHCLESPLPEHDDTLISYIPIPDFSQPAARFEKRMGLSGIARTYVMPEGLTPENLQTYERVLRHASLRSDMTTEQAVEKLSRVYDRLAEDNPELKGLKFDRADRGNLRDVLLGVASAFNTTDIESFIADRKNPPSPQKTRDYQTLRKRMESVYGLMNWKPATATLENIERQMQAPVAPRAGARPENPGF